MKQNLILLPVFAQVLLTGIVLCAMLPARAKSRHERGQQMQDFAVASDKDWNESALQISNNYKNLFELPVLFYAVTAFALITQMVDSWMLGLAWAFVLSRIIHSAIHATSNVVIWRMGVFGSGVTIVLAMWVLLMWRVAAAGF